MCLEDDESRANVSRLAVVVVVSWHGLSAAAVPTHAFTRSFNYGMIFLVFFFSIVFGFGLITMITPEDTGSNMKDEGLTRIVRPYSQSP